MIEKLCNRITERMKKEMPEIDETKAEVINYGLQLIIGEVPKIVAIFFLAYALGVLKYTLIAYLVIFPYRTFSGRISFKDTYRLLYRYKFILLWKRISKQNYCITTSHKI